MKNVKRLLLIFLSACIMLNSFFVPELFVNAVIEPQILVANSANRVDNSPDGARADYWNNFCISGGSATSWLWTTYNSNPAIFSFDLADTTTTFEPVFVGEDYAGTFKIYGSKDNVNWSVVAEMTSTYTKGVVYNSTNGMAFGDPSSPNYTGGTSFSTLDQSNIDLILANNTSKTVYMKIGDIVSDNPDQWGSRIQLRYFGITSNSDDYVAPLDFAFSGSMSKEVLRNYASRAVTSWIVLEGNNVDPIFEEDLRMTLRIGAKYLGRAASFSWNGNMTASQVNEHFEIAEEQAARVHAADPEIILQGAIFEIVYRSTVDNTAIPAWVFEDFDLTVETRNFNYNNVAFPVGHEYGPGFWGTGTDSAIPKIANIEAQMYFYYNICRYIDAGFESIHLGQVEKMMEYMNENNAVAWDKVTTLGRAYAENHARRGVVLFDGHSNIDSSGITVGDRLILDIQAAALVPNETVTENGAMKCEISDYSENWLQWIGRTGGGTHPLGFEIDNNFTIVEFDNYGGNGQPGVATPEAFFVWGYDDITWFALQPEWYRNQFLLECNTFLKNNDLDSEGKQVYFLQPSLRRTITSDQTMTYTPSSAYKADFMQNYLDNERTGYTFDEQTTTFDLTITKDYRANRQSDGCPNGSGQENTIREIFLGQNAPEDPGLLEVVLPPAYDDKILVANSANRSDNSPDNTRVDYWNNFYISGGSATSWLWTTYNSNPAIFSFDLADTTTTFEPVFVGEDYAGTFKIYGSKDNVNWFVVAEMTSTYTNGVVYNSTNGIAFGDPSSPNTTGGTSFSTLNQANIDMILANNTSKTVYMKIGDIVSDNPDQYGSRIQLRYFGITYYVPVVIDMVANSANRSDSTPDSTRADYWNNFYVSGGSATSWLWTTYNSNPAVFSFDLPDTTTNFEPVFAGEDYAGTFNIYGSKDNVNWSVVAEMTSTYTSGVVYNSTSGIVFGDPSSPNTTGGKSFSTLNQANIDLILANNLAKVIYLKIGDIVSDNPDQYGSRIQLRYFGVTLN